MNAKTRKQLEKIGEQIMALQTEITDIKYAEQEKFDNMPESLQSGAPGDKLQNTLDTLDAVGSALDEAYNELQNIK